MSSSTIEQIQQQLNDLQAQISQLKSQEQTSAPQEENSEMSEEEMMAAMMADDSVTEEMPLTETSAEMLEVAGDFNPQAAIDYTNNKRNNSDVAYSEETLAFFQHEDTLQRIMHAVKDGILLVDKHGVIRGFSKGAEDIFGYKEEDVIDTRAQKLFPHDEREKFKRFFFKLNEEADAALDASADLPQATTELDAKHFLHADMRRVKLDMHATPFDGSYFYICLAQDMREKLKHQERMQERSNLAQLLREVARSLNNAETIEQAIGETLEHLGQQLHFDLGHAYIYCAQEKTFKSHGHWVAPQGGEFALFKNTTAQTTFSESEGLIGVTFQYAEPQNFAFLDESLNDNRLTAMKSTGFKQGLTIPVLVKDIPVAVIELYLRENIEVDEHMIDILHNIGYQVGHTLRRLEVEHRLSGETNEQHLDTVIASAATTTPGPNSEATVELDDMAMELIETSEEAAFEEAPALSEPETDTNEAPLSEEEQAEQLLNASMGMADMVVASTSVEETEEQAITTEFEDPSFEETTMEAEESIDMDMIAEESSIEIDFAHQEGTPDLSTMAFEEPEDTTLSDISFDDDEPVMTEPEPIMEEEEVHDLSPLQKLALESEESKYNYTEEGTAVRREESALDMKIHGITDVKQPEESVVPQAEEPEFIETTTQEPVELSSNPLSALEEVAMENSEAISVEDSDEYVSEEDRKIAEQMMQMG